MLRLALILFAMIGTTLMGMGVVAVLAMGKDTAGPITLAALAGFVLAIPISWFVSRQILKGQAGG